MKNEDEVAMIERSLAVFSFFCARVLSGLLFQVCSHGWRERSKISHWLRDETQNPARKKGKRSLALSLSRLQWDRGSRERERDSDIFGAEHPLDGDALSLFRSTQSLLSCAQERELSLKKSLAEAWRLSSRRPGRSRAGKGASFLFPLRLLLGASRALPCSLGFC